MNESTAVGAEGRRSVRRAALLRGELARDRAANGHQAIANALKFSGVSHIYTLPGNPVYATIGACSEAGIQVIGCRSQSGALGAALAHNFQSGALRAVALCSPSPGVTNSITSLSDASSNNWPMVLIGGVVEEPLENEPPVQGAARFQSFDGAQAVAPCCKSVIKLEKREDLEAEIGRALRLAQATPCGPVFVEVGAAVLNARHQECLPASVPKAVAASVPQNVRELLATAQRPVLILGEDLRWQTGLTDDKLTRLRVALERLQLPVLATDMGRGILPDSHPLSVFLAKEEALKRCDQLLLCGASLDWRFEARSFLADQVPVIQLPACVDALLELFEAAVRPGAVQHAEIAPSGEPDLVRTSSVSTWWSRDLAKAHERRFSKLRQQAGLGSEAGQIDRLCEMLGNWVPDNTVSIIDSGLGLSSGHNFWPVQQPYSRMTPGLNGTIGPGIPFALGCAVQTPNRPVVALVGDVGFGLSAVELETAQRIGARVVIVVADNGGINGRGFQNRWLPENSPDVLRFGGDVDYAMVARGWGARGVTTASPEALRLALTEAFHTEGPTVISVPMRGFFGSEQSKRAQTGQVGQND